MITWASWDSNPHWAGFGPAASPCWARDPSNHGANVSRLALLYGQTVITVDLRRIELRTSCLQGRRSPR